MTKIPCRDWSNAIGRRIFSEGHAGRFVYLAVDQDEIADIGDKKFGLDAEMSFESFRSAVIAEVSHGWPETLGRTQAGNYPSYLALLAAQVVAAFQMHDDGAAGAGAYWRRLRQFLGESPEDRRPDQLSGDAHSNLWRSLEHWANEVEGGSRGRLRLVRKVDGHRLVAEPLGQCLLRRADLERLQGLFAKLIQPGVNEDRHQWLSELVDPERTAAHVHYFTAHGRRVLKDPDRHDAAWEQIYSEYDRFPFERNADPIPASRRPRSRRGRPRRSTTVLLKVRQGRIVGGLYQRVDDERFRKIVDLHDLLRRFYLRVGREVFQPAHQPPHDQFLLAARNESHDPFTERRTCRAGDEVLLLVPARFLQDWLKDAREALFVKLPAVFQSTSSTHLNSVPSLDGLPEEWSALRFEMRDDVSNVPPEGKWIEIVRRNESNLRLMGGLLLKRGVWMLGAGPAIQVAGPRRHAHILINGERHPLDESQTVLPEFELGEHVARLSDSNARGLRIRIEEPVTTSAPENAGWHWNRNGWPTEDSKTSPRKAKRTFGTLRGAKMLGVWPARQESEQVPTLSEPIPHADDMPLELAALTLAVRLRFARSSPARQPLLESALRIASAPNANPLLRGMLLASRAFPFPEEQ